MTFDPINAVNGIVVLFLVLPLFLAARHGITSEQETVSELHLILERAGFVLSCILMVIPLNMAGMKFGYSSAEIAVITFAVMLGCLILNDAALLVMLRRGRSRLPAVITVICPAVIFLLNGAVLIHPALLISGAVYFTAALDHVLLDTQEEEE